MSTEVTAEYLASQGLSQTFPQRFWEKVDKTSTHWFWMGTTRPCSKRWPKGHGQIQRREGVNCKIYVHRAAWILCVGPIPEGMEVLHICPGGAIPYCVNPEHLEIGDQFRNMQQMTAEGHNHFSTHSFKGSEHGMSKLTWEQVREIRRLRATGKYFLRELAGQFGISIPTCSHIVRNELWVE